MTLSFEFQESDLDVIDRHIAGLQQRLDSLEVQVQAAADEHHRRRELVTALDMRREVLPLELQQARGAAESGAVKVAELSRLLEAARADTNAHRARAHQLEGEAAELDDRLARARQGLEVVDHAAVKERNQVAVDLATAVRRRGELIAAEAKAADDHLRRVLEG